MIINIPVSSTLCSIINKNSMFFITYFYVTGSDTVVLTWLYLLSELFSGEPGWLAEDDGW